MFLKHSVQGLCNVFLCTRYKAEAWNLHQAKPLEHGRGFRTGNNPGDGISLNASKTYSFPHTIAIS